MIMSFSVFREKIESGTKTQTIRPYNERQFKRMCNAKKYQLYWGNPRNGGTLIKEVVPRQEPEVFSFCVDKNEKIEELAIEDGFDNAWDMVTWFYKMYEAEMFTRKFMIIRWKP